MPGVADGLVLARRILLDALAALGEHRNAVVLVGAQAIYLRVGEIGIEDIAVQPFTNDGDLAIDPELLTDDPKLDEVLLAASFTRGSQPGMWYSPARVRIDLMVPQALGGRPGRRGADLHGHGTNVARQARGLEAALVDNNVLTISALEDGDERSFELRVAGAAALLVAKMHKLADRHGDEDRLAPKDALDVLRILRGTTTSEIAAELNRLAGERLSQEVTTEGIRILGELFGRSNSTGSVLAGRSVLPLGDPATIAASCAALTQDLLRSLERGRR